MSEPSQDTPHGRPAQRRRTRAALLEAAARMMQDGRGLPSVADVAAAADISRRTAYRYFPTAEQLATEAVLQTLAPRLESPDPNTIATGDAATRVEATVRQMMEAAVANESLLRTMIRLTIDQPPRAGGGRRPSSRGTRRVAWLRDALQPLKHDVDRRTQERLLSALCLCVGAEALIALRDVRGLSTDQAIEVCVWAAEALVHAAQTGPSRAASARGRR